MKPFWLLLALVFMMMRPACAAQTTARDWSAVQLAWREDPRPPADAPFEADVPRGRRATRRSQRRVTTRRMPLDGVSIEENARLPVGTIPRPEGQHEPIAHRDQPYVQQPDSRQRFDILLPTGCSGGGRLPLVVWVHGDSWRDGSKADCPVRWLAEHGYAVASIGYRLSDTATFPAQLDDCRAAVDALASNAEVWGIDRDRIAVIGAGGGGHLAALVGLSADAPTDAAAGQAATTAPASTRVAALCTIAAPAHLTTLGPAHDRPSSPASLLIGGPLPEFREVAQQASPLAHVSADDPPSLVIHGDRDEQVPTEQGIRLDAALKAAGIDSTLVVLENVGHEPALDRGSTAGRAVLEFLDRTLGPGLHAEHVEGSVSRPAHAQPPHAEAPSVVVPAAR